ncbi:MAG: gliding motility lipoprotein GldD [Bacteroidales bacterium]|nr:gliding motility lipoprotein GldD [Bacteroidales bacterium]
MQIARKSVIFTILLIITLLISWNCKKKSQTTPRPRGYFRIDLPEKEYKPLQINCSYTFEYPAYTEIVRDPGGVNENCWINIHYPQFNGDIHISYKKIQNNFKTYVEDARNLAYKHTIKAEAIQEEQYRDRKRNMYGIFYNLKGNVASPAQFFVTDSNKHFLRGSLYFRTEPNQDSLAPVIQFVKKDMKHLIETLHWKN